MGGAVADCRLFLADETDTEALGRALASVVERRKCGATVFLEGNLGAGKTTLSRGVIRGMGHTGAVKSPTYTIVEPYEHLEPMVYHFDLYRLGDPEELEYLGIRDYFEGTSLCLIEWPERGEGVLAAPDLRLILEPNGDGRDAVLQAHTPAGKEILDDLLALNPAGG